MKKTLAYFSAALIFFALLLVFSTSTSIVKADPPPQRCEDCMQNVQAHFDKCLAKYGQEHIPCYDEFNEGVVHCFAHFCEQ